jgi:hypothetical protein
MGIKVSIVELKNGGNRESAFATMVSEMKPMEDNMDSSIRFARSLGFYEDGEWSLTAQQQPEELANPSALEESGGSRLSYLADESEISALLQAAHIASSPENN